MGRINLVLGITRKAFAFEGRAGRARYPLALDVVTGVDDSGSSLWVPVSESDGTV